MTFKYNNVYLNNVSTVVGPYEKEGPLGSFFDKAYNKLSVDNKTWEQSESEMIIESVDLLLYKEKLLKNNIDLHISGDLLNQIVSTNYASSLLGIPLIGIYSACSTSVLGMILGSNMVDSNQINKCIVSTSSNNNGAEKQFRQPIEYGGPKKVMSTFTTTGAASMLLSNLKSKIRIESSTLGKVIDMGIKDPNNIGAIMAPSAAYTIYTHLKEMNRTADYYDLILTGDLGKYGREILKDYLASEYNIEILNYEDCGCLIYDLNNKLINAGGSGPACLPLVFNSYFYRKMISGEIKKVLLVATGALFSQTMVNQKNTIPSISHAISLEVLDDIY